MGLTPKYCKLRLMNGASALAMTGVLAISLPAMAQDAVQDQDQDNDSGAIETIIVTGTKRALNIQDVAQSITAFSTADIERRGILNMENVAAAIPSISLTSTRPGVNEIVYRGVSSGSGDWYKDSQVAVYLDDQPMTASTTQIDPRMVDIERIESLPGPQGTLFGSSSQTGTLRIITNKPSFERYSGQANAEVKTTKGGEMSYDFSGHINVPLVEDKLAIRIVGFKARDGGYIDNVLNDAPHGTGAVHVPFEEDGPYSIVQTPPGGGAVPNNAAFVEENFNDYDIKGGRLSALWAINEDWDMLATFMTQDSTSTGTWSTNTALGDYNTASFNDEFRKDKWWSAAVTLKGDLGFAQLSNSFAYVDREQSYSFDNTHYEASHTAYGKYWSNYYNSNGYYDYLNYYDLFDTGYQGSTYKSLQEAQRFSNEIRLTSSSNSRFDWMIGGFYENVKDGWDDYSVIPNLENTRSWQYAQQLAAEYPDLATSPLILQKDPGGEGDYWYRNLFEREISQVAVFGEVGYQITDKFHVQAGYRWFEYDRHTVTDDQWPPGLPVKSSLEIGEGPLQIQDGKESNQAFKFSAQFDIDDDRMVYFTFSQGFRLGGSNSSKAVSTGLFERNYGPDKMDNYEVGIKSEWLDNRLQINANVFFMDWKDIQVSLGDPDRWWINGQVNAKGGRNLGAELDFTWRVTSNFKINGNAYIGNPYFTGSYNDNEGEEIMQPGTPMPNASKNKFSIGADYTIDNIYKDVGLYVRYDFSYRGGLYSRLEEAYEEGAFDIESSSMSNLQVGFEIDDQTTVTFMVRNLFNQRSNTYTSYGTEGYAEDWGTQSRYGPTHNLARPRTMSLKLMKKF